MAGKGFAPSGRRVSKDHTAQRTVAFRRGEQPCLPETQDWHPQTVQWWRMWAESTLSADFTAADWSFLLDTALMHHAMWSKGQWALAAEVRLRVAKFGQTPEDRARLRIVFADADEKDSRRTGPPPEGSARARRGPLKAV